MTVVDSFRVDFTGSPGAGEILRSSIGPFGQQLNLELLTAGGSPGGTGLLPVLNIDLPGKLVSDVVAEINAASNWAAESLDAESQDAPTSSLEVGVVDGGVGAGLGPIRKADLAGVGNGNGGGNGGGDGGGVAPATRDMLRSGSRFLHAQRHRHMSRPVVYSRGGDSVELRATIGSTTFEQQDEFGILQKTEVRDFLVRAIDLVLGGARREPRNGDRVREIDESGGVYVYEVQSPPGGGGPPFRFSDPERQTLRIHTRLISGEAFE